MKVKDIDTSTIDGKILVMKLFDAGHTLLAKDKLIHEPHWRVTSIPSWDWNTYDYAIADKPTEIWVVRDLSGYYKRGVYMTEAEAKAAAAELSAFSGVEHFVCRFIEVTE